MTLQVRSVDRIFLAGNVPRLQSEGLLVRFLLDRGFSIPSPALLGRIGAGYVRAVDRFAAKQKVPVVHFKRGESKEQVAREYMLKAEREGRFGVVMIGVAQEKAWVWRGFRRGGSDAHPHFSYRRMSAFPNHFDFYIRDADWGPGFVKTVGYAPFGVWIYLNGHEWAKRQAIKRGISFEALDNGFRSVADADALAGICQSLSDRDIERFWARWEARLPSVFTADDRLRGYRYRLSVRQLELSDTRVFERPAQGREWFHERHERRECFDWAPLLGFADGEHVGAAVAGAGDLHAVVSSGDVAAVLGAGEVAVAAERLEELLPVRGRSAELREQLSVRSADRQTVVAPDAAYVCLGR